MKELIQSLRQKNGNLYDTLIQFIKFGLVGVSNTAISYGTEMLFFYVLFVHLDMPENIKILIVSVISFVVSVTNSYYWNNRFVFKGGSKSWKEHLKVYFKTMLCYGVTGLVLAPLLKMWLSKLSIPFWLASLLTLIVTIPLNFLLNKLWAYRKNETEA